MRTSEEAPDGPPPCQTPLMNGEGRDSVDNHQNNETEGKVQIEQPQKIPSDVLRRNPYIVLLTLSYAAIALFAWVVLCILTYRPIGVPGGSYTVDYHGSEVDVGTMPRLKLFSLSERYLRAAKVLQPIASMLTIPLTSMVCSCAAVAFLQRQPSGGRQGPTLRQSMALADKGWTDPMLLSTIVTGGWKRYGSMFLLMALFLNLLGASIAPLQGIFVSSRSIKVPSMNVSLSDSITDLASLIVNYEPSELDTGMTITQLRTRLTSTNYADPQFRLWSREKGCLSDYDPSPVCVTSGQYTFGNMGHIRDPFWAQLPSGFSTGLVQQFAPRVNFTSKYENITAAEFPENCDQIPGALFYHHDNRTEYDGYAVDVCMPYNVSVSPWKSQRSRQDFSEELYLNITFSGFDAKSLLFETNTPKAGTYAFKATLTTTGGYFELPNYMNGHLPGPLLDDDPEPHCGQQCPDQNFEPIGPDSVLHDVYDDPTPSYPDRSLAYIMNKGPLVSIVLALFGPGSYLDIRRTVIEAYQHSSEEFIGCEAIVPIMNLLTAPHEDAFSVSSRLGPCVDSNHPDMFDVMSSYLWLFAASSGNNLPSAERIQDALTASGFLAVDIWFGSFLGGELYVSNRPSNDLQIPFISPAGVVLVSVVLGIYLTCMLALSVYSAWTPRWTNQLDSFAMMRIGGSMPRRLPFLLAHSPGKVDALDELPGWIGDVAGAQGGEVNRVGELGLGGDAPVKRGARYRSYPVNIRTESESSDTGNS